jgi:putative membrane protein
MNPEKNAPRNIPLFLYLISFVVLAFLFWLIYFKTGADASGLAWVSLLPLANAILNFITSCFLLIGYYFIKVGKKLEHIASMLCATMTSAIFLVSYIVYHHFHGDTKFIAEGGIRYVYFFILISHIILSMVMVPLVFGTLYHAARKNFSVHKKLAKWTFPIWLYVSITGVLIYIFLKFLNH